MATIPGSDASSTATGAGETVSQPDYKQLYEETALKATAAQKAAEEWKQRHSGLQGKYQQEQEKWVKDTDRLLSIDEQLKSVSGEREKLAIERDTLARTVAEAKAAADKATNSASRLQLIAKDFPHLLQFEADGLLPDGQGDDFKAKLARFTEKLNGKGQEAIKEFRSGEAPPPPKETVAGTSVAMFKQANIAMRAGKMDEYNRLYDQAVALKRAGK